MSAHTGIFCASRCLIEEVFVGEGEMPLSLRLTRPLATTLRSAYTFDAETPLMEVLGESLGEDLNKNYIVQKAEIFTMQEESNLSTTTGTDVSDGSTSDGSASDRLPKSTTSDGSPGGSDGSDTDDSRFKRRANEPWLPPPSRSQRRLLGAGRPWSDVASQSRGSVLSESSSACPTHRMSESNSSCPTHRMKEEGDNHAAAAREACASARGLGSRLGSELSSLDDEMFQLAQELKTLKSYIMPAEDNHK